jgi:hypothetical protein
MQWEQICNETRASQSDLLSSWNGEFSSKIRVSITNQFPERQNQQFGFLVVCAANLILIIQYIPIVNIISLSLRRSSLGFNIV